MTHVKEINYTYKLKLYYLLIIIAWFFCLYPITANANDTLEQNFTQRFEDENTLLLRPKVGRTIFEDDIYTIYKKGKLYLSFEDFIAVLNLAIDYNPSKKMAEGWFLREDWNFKLDFNNKTISSRDESFTLSKENTLLKNEQYFISIQDLENWFGFHFIPDIPQQYIEIITPYPLPIIAKQNRLSRRSASNNRNEATLPRYKQKRQWLDINTADIQLGTRLQRRNNGNNDRISSTRNSSIIAVEGQALKHDARLLTSYNNLDGLSSITGSLSLRDENPVLLGPLKARQYTIGDTPLSTIPLLGNTTQELGFRTTNNTLTNTQFQTTIIDGQAFPGWDVELYRNNILIGIQTVDGTGQYEFSNVQLFGGDNKFEIFFYGPQGEIERQEINTPVTNKILNAQKSFYNFSITSTDTQLYKNNDLSVNDEQELHFAGQYNQQIGNGTGYIGFRHREINDENTAYFGAGYTTALQNIILDTNLGANARGELSSQIQLRRNISGWDLITTAKAQTDDYTPDGEERATTFQLSTSTQKGFQPTPKSRINLFSRGNYSRLSDDSTQTTSQIGVSYQANNFSLSNNLNYNYTSLSQSSEKRFNNNISARYNTGDFFLRGGMNAILHPTREIDDYFAQVTYRPSNKLSGDLRLTHKPIQDKTEGRLNINYTNKYFRASPFIEYDSDQDLFAGVNLNFSIIDKSDDSGFEMTHRRLAGKGLVSSLVYHDKNGNLEYDEGDEILPDVVVESLNVRRRELTNGKGYSLIKDLPTNRATDIVIDEETLPDSFMIAAKDGVSILPNPGEIIELQFPIHLSGEIDGTISLVEGENSQPIRRAKIELHPLSRKKQQVIEIETALDGFYVGSEIPPGRYIMKISDKTAKKFKAGATAPQVIEIGFEGDVIYGVDLNLDTKRPHVPVQITHKNIKDSNQINREIYVVNTENAAQSKLASLLSSFAKKQAPQDIFDGFAPLPFVQDAKFNSQKKNSYLIAQEQDIETTHNKCLELLSNGIACSMEIIIPDQMQSSQMF